MYGRLGRILRQAQRGEDGQMLVIAALFMTVLLGFAGLAIDVGFVMHTRTKLQANVDAMAMAAVRDLCNLPAICEATARASAEDYAERNDLGLDEVENVRFTTTCNGDSFPTWRLATVEATHDQATFFLRVLGHNEAPVSACATARVGTSLGGNNLLPFGFHRIDPYNGVNPEDVCYFYEEGGTVHNPNLWNSTCLIKIPSPSDSWGSGNSGAIRLDEGGEPDNYDPDCNPGNSGASEYEENIREGSECFYAVNDQIRPKPGNMKGPTCSAFGTRLGGNNETLTQVFGTPDALGVHKRVNTRSPRFGIVPIVTVSGNGSSQLITIRGFVTVYINGACGSGNCNGNGNNPACVTVTPVKSNVWVEGMPFTGGLSYSDDNPLRITRLIN